MKRLFLFVICIILLTGCASGSNEMDRALALRSKIQRSQITFDVELTADYGNRTYDFSMACKGDAEGNITFTVTAPESIAGISGTIAGGTGKFRFDNEFLAFEVLADGLISPVGGPWVMIKALRSGYLTSCGSEGDGWRLSIDDSYQENALHLDIWLDGQDVLQRCEIYWQGRRLLTMRVSNLVIL